MDEKRQEMFLNGLNDDKQFQLLNTNYENFQHLVDKAIIIENKLMVMRRDDKWKILFPGQHSGSNTRPHISQPSQFFRALHMSHLPMQVSRLQFQN
jgi:hypothetical protein